MFFPGSNITCFTFYIYLWHIYWLSFIIYIVLLDFVSHLSVSNENVCFHLQVKWKLIYISPVRWTEHHHFTPEQKQIQFPQRHVLFSIVRRLVTFGSLVILSITYHC
jgi:hypothetical protein